MRTNRFQVLRASAWVVNAALMVWVLEALGVLVALVFVERTDRIGDQAVAILTHSENALLIAQGGAAFLLLVALVTRHFLNAEPLCRNDHLWLSSFLLVALYASTYYILVVGAREFDRYRIFTGEPQRWVTPRGPAHDKELQVIIREADPVGERAAFREARVQLGIIASLGAMSAIGLLILNVLGTMEPRGRPHKARPPPPPWRRPGGT